MDTGGEVSATHPSATTDSGLAPHWFPLRTSTPGLSSVSWQEDYTRPHSCQSILTQEYPSPLLLCLCVPPYWGTPVHLFRPRYSVPLSGTSWVETSSGLEPEVGGPDPLLYKGSKFGGPGTAKQRRRDRLSGPTLHWSPTFAGGVTVDDPTTDPRRRRVRTTVAGTESDDRDPGFGRRGDPGPGTHRHRGTTPHERGGLQGTQNPNLPKLRTPTTLSLVSDPPKSVSLPERVSRPRVSKWWVPSRPGGRKRSGIAPGRNGEDRRPPRSTGHHTPTQRGQRRRQKCAGGGDTQTETHV